MCTAVMSGAELKEFGEIIDARQAAVVIVEASTLQQALNKAGLTADKHVARSST